MKAKSNVSMSSSHTFLVDKTSEGGLGQRYWMRELKRLGYKCKPDHSPYVGQSGIRVDNITDADIDRIETLLYGSGSNFNFQS